MTKLEEYYNKFNEEKRLLSRHGHIEFVTSMKYIHMCIDMVKKATYKSNEDIKILDIGAATGGYSIPLFKEGFDVSAIEPVKHNLGLLKKKCTGVHAYQGNAMKLKRFPDETFDITLVFVPMYHLHDFDEKVMALKEAKRVTRKGGYILVAYIMNEYSVITYAFKEGHIKEALLKGMLDEDFHTTEIANELYSFVRLEDIDRINKACDIDRFKIIAADGPANYMRQIVNALDDEEFEAFIKYHLKTCERMDLMGASGHTVDILRN